MTFKVTFVLGGAASGKSAYAEALVEASGMQRVYLASAQSLDGEMAEKIRLHKNRRGAGWITREAPLDAAGALDEAGAEQCVLFDCATMWLSNHLLAESDLDRVQAELMAALNRCKARLVIVSNEVGQGIVPDTSLGRRFRDAQGRLNIALAARAGLVVQVVAGLPVVLKGTLP